MFSIVNDRRFRNHRVAVIAGLLFIITLGVFVNAALVEADAQRITPQTIQLDTDANLPPQIRSQEQEAFPLAFDRDTTTEYTAYGNSQVTLQLAQETDISQIKVYGAAPYSISVQAWVSGTWQAVSGLQALDLSSLTDKWHAYRVTSPVSTERLKISLSSSTGGDAAGLKELEIWGEAERVTINTGANLLAAMESENPPVQGRLYAADQTEGIIGDVVGLAEDKSDNRFTVNVAQDPATVKRAWLSYESHGAGHWISVNRSINGQAALGGSYRFASSAWSGQVEALNPGWLVAGENSIAFNVPADNSYRIRKLKLLLELDDGSNMVAQISAAPQSINSNAQLAHDGDSLSGWRPYASATTNKTAPYLQLDFDKATQLDAIALELDNQLRGKIELEVLENGEWNNAGTGAIVGKNLREGWNHIAIQSDVPVDGIKLVFFNGSGSTGEILEVAPIGSGVGKQQSPPRIEVGYPDAGQYYGDEAYIRGFVQPVDNGSGQVKTFIAGREISRVDGAFEALVNIKDFNEEAGLYFVTVDALYPDGTQASRKVYLTDAYSAKRARSTLQSYAYGSSAPTANPAKVLQQAISPVDNYRIEHDESILQLSKEALEENESPRKISIASLKHEDLPPLNPGMTNVTKGPRNGYRFAPHGKKFRKNIEVYIPYDKTKIPAGLTEEDIKTWYFDEEVGRWVPLEKVAVDQQTKHIKSHTDHFTDMINATIVVPDSPNPTSFNETTIKGIKAADPGSAINLIEAPQANNTGDARLSYPIEVPPGRNGMQPQLAITYNSSGGNGWLGVGWDLSVPSISIDTRWGVPHYDEAKHEEIYLLNGQQLVKTDTGNGYSEYRPRIEGAFERIRRYGSDAGSYWWVVTDKSGTRSVYGGDDSAQLHNNQDENRKVFTWYLNRMVDSNGNTVDYEYDFKTLDKHNEGESAVYTYLKEIRYSGHLGKGASTDAIRHTPEKPVTDGSYYRVQFERKSGREDVVVDGRPGFKTVMDQRLKNIIVSYVDGTDKNIRSYTLEYDLDADFNKTLLEHIVQNDADGTEFNRHTLEYEKMQRDDEGHYQLFSDLKTWKIPDSNIGSGLSASKNQDFYGGATVSLFVNLENPHIGAGGGGSRGTSTTVFSMMDINGDGLPDLFDKEAKRYYKNPWQHGDTKRDFVETILNTSIDDLNKDENEVWSGDAGIHYDTSFGLGEIRLNATLGASGTKVDGKQMMSDVNGDGLVDQINVSSGIMMVKLNNGVDFDEAIVWNGGVNISPGLTETEKQELRDRFPLADMVRAWTAPYTGKISFTGSLSLTVKPDLEQHEDGVTIDIYRNKEKDALWSYTIKDDSVVSLASIAGLQDITVNKDDRFYIKVGSVADVKSDTLNTDITIEYQYVDYIDQNESSERIQTLQSEQINTLASGLPQFTFNSITDFALASPVERTLEYDEEGKLSGWHFNEYNSKGAWVVPYKGTVKLSHFLNKQKTSEDLLLRVLKATRNEEDGTIIDSQVVYETLLQGGKKYDVTNQVLKDQLEVERKEILIFDVSLPKLGAIDARRYTWKPEVRYTYQCVDARSNSDLNDHETIVRSEEQDPETSQEEYFDTENCRTLTAAEQELTDADLQGALLPEGISPTKLYIYYPTPILNVYPMAHNEPVRSWIAPRTGKIRLATTTFKNLTTPSDIHVKIQTVNGLVKQQTFKANETTAQFEPQVEYINLDVVKGQKLFFSIHSAKPYPETVSDDDTGQETTTFSWKPEILYIDPQHCYEDSEAQQQCVAVQTAYTSNTNWGMHFDELCLSAERCVVVDCYGERSYMPGSWTAKYCETTEPNPAYDPKDPVNTGPEIIKVRLTGQQRAAFNLNRYQYMIPAINQATLDWGELEGTPLAGHYRHWSYVAWNGSQDWDAEQLVLPDDNLYKGIDTDTEDGQQEAAEQSQNYYYQMVQARQNGTSRHPDVTLWLGHGLDSYIARSASQPSRVGTDIGRFIYADDDQGSATINELRKTTTYQEKLSIGANGSGFSLNKGNAKTKVDFLDLNGDRYPDQVSNSDIVFNNGKGGFSTTSAPLSLSVNTHSDVRYSTSETVGLSFSIGFNFNDVNSMGKVIGVKSLGPSFGTNYGSSATKAEFLDINGDGLSDRVSRDGEDIKVRLNLGYDDKGGIRFGAQETWTAGDWERANISRLDEIDKVSPNILRVNDTVSISGGIGAEQVGVAGASASRSVSGSRTIVDLQDINGDGLPDLVMKEHDGDFKVRLNNGSSFETKEYPWATNDWGFKVGHNGTAALYGGNDVLGYQESWSNTGGVNVHGAIPIPIPLCCILWPHAKYDGNATYGEGGTSLMMMDINGDGAPDHVYRNSTSQEIYVKPNNSARANLLKRIVRPLGGSIELDYKRDGNVIDESNLDHKIVMNSSKWVLSKAVVNDGKGNAYPTEFNYFNSGYYDRKERENYGYAHIQTTRADGATTDQFFHNQSYTNKGLLFRSVFRDEDGALYTRTEQTYKDQLIVAAEESQKIVRFPYLESTEQHYYEGQETLSGELTVDQVIPAGKKQSKQVFEYQDDYGNITKLFDYADLNTDDDNIEATLVYFVDESSHIVGLANEITVKDKDENILRHRSADIDAVTGNTRKIHQTVGVKTATTKLDYDSAGNLTRIENPKGDDTDAYARSYAYDNKKLNSHVIEISDTLGYTSTIDEIDYRYGQPVTTTDINGNKSIYKYDNVGRVSEIYGPNEIDKDGKISSTIPTIAFDYYPDGYGNSADPFAITKHIDPYRGDGKDTIDTVMIIDGIKRVLQTKKEASLHQSDNTAKPGRIISGRVVFDELGRVKEQYYPREDYDQAADKFIEKFDSVTATKMTYDVLGRVILVTLPDLTTTSTDYSFAKDRDGLEQFQIIITDANTNRKESYRDTNERITAVKEYISSDDDNKALWTSYVYDALGQIEQVKDAKDKRTVVDYDQLGRRIAIDNPDTGLTKMRYDLAGNLVAKVTANLGANGEQTERPIVYRYKQTLLTGIEYPDNPLNNVTYTYGEHEAEHNRAGRIATVSHSVGTEERFYGKLGETVRELKTYQVGPHTNVYDTRYEHDSFGRLQHLTLPDGEAIDYDYDAGGNLTRIHGVRPDRAAPHSVDQVYLEALHYDKFEQRAYMLQGNGVVTQYQYDAQTRRLDILTATRKGNIIFQNQDYGYDPVGNISTLNNPVDVTPANVFGGPINQRFTYDSLNRLKTASGDFEYRQGRFHKYTLGMDYDEIHNITRKNQRHTLEFNNKVQEQRGTTYDWAYDYNGSQPHAPTNIGDRTFTYDANGNQTGWTHDKNGTSRTIVWDEENRIQAIQDPKNTLRFQYDDAGERIIKTGQHGTTVYVNQYYTVRNGATVSKHIFAGSSRIATRFRYGGQNRTDSGLTDSTTEVKQPPGLLKSVVDKVKGKTREVVKTVKTYLGFEEHPGQGLEHRSERANEVAQNTVKNKHLNGGVPGGEHGNGNGNNGNNGNENPGNGNNSGNNGNGQSGGLGGEQAEEFLYYYHPDHLGSTSYVTDEDAAIYEHIAYFPHGETWVEQATNSQRIQYKYTSKELDTETGLYYYGARYYDPRTSVWQSVDRILDDYLNGDRGMGGVFNSKNLGMFTYSYHNPVILIDPDGNEVLMGEIGIGRGSSAEGGRVGSTISAIGGHTWIIARPDNPAEFSRVRPDVRLDKTGAFVVRGGPDESFNLTGKGNLVKSIGTRTADSATDYRQANRIKTPMKYTHKQTRRGMRPKRNMNTSGDTQFIMNLLDNAESYSDNLPYHGTVGEFGLEAAGAIEEGVDYYNSNSFTSGVLKASGVKNIPDPYGYQPGLDKPAPLGE